MPAKEILDELRNLASAGWRIRISNGRAHAYARAYCPGGAAGCDPLTVYGTPKVPEHEAKRIRIARQKCRHGTAGSGRRAR